MGHPLRWRRARQSVARGPGMARVPIVSVSTMAKTRTPRGRQALWGQPLHFNRGLPPNKRMELVGALVLKEAGRLCAGGQLFTFTSGVRGARVARGSCAGR